MFNTVFVLAVGLVAGAFATFTVIGFDEIATFSEGYRAGRTDTLNQTVTLEAPEPCNISVSLGSIPKLISMGVFDWHKACVEAVKGVEP